MQGQSLGLQVLTIVHRQEVVKSLKVISFLEFSVKQDCCTDCKCQNILQTRRESDWNRLSTKTSTYLIFATHVIIIISFQWLLLFFAICLEKQVVNDIKHEKTFLYQTSLVIRCFPFGKYISNFVNFLSHISTCNKHLSTIWNKKLKWKCRCDSMTDQSKM